MKHLFALLFFSISLLGFAQSNNEPSYTLEPTSSKIIGGYFAIDGNSSWSENGNNSNAHSISIGPYMSLKRSTKRDVLLRTNLFFQSSGNGTQRTSNSMFSATIGVDWRHQLYQFNKFKVFGSYGPRLGFNLQNSPNSDTNLGFDLAAVGNVSLAYEFNQNFRLLTSIFNGSAQYSRFGGDYNRFNYSIRNSILTPNFSIEYILPSKA
ncbi:MAG: hypothetical protein AB8F78_10990 [Saprospiraceae bacterium]